MLHADGTGLIRFRKRGARTQRGISDGLKWGFAPTPTKGTESLWNPDIWKVQQIHRFHHNGIGVYNPFSLINAFSDNEFNAYWFESGTPSFLIKQVRQNNFDVRRFTDNTIYANELNLKDYTGDSLDLIPLLYQSGYLTIADYNAQRRRYTLAFPNEEVKYAFLESLMPAYGPSATAGNGLDIFTFEDHIENGDLRSDDHSRISADLFQKGRLSNSENLVVKI